MFAFLISNTANYYQYIIFGETPFFDLMSSMNNVSAVLVPIIQYSFLCITVKLILGLFGVTIKIDELSKYVSYSFVFVLIPIVFFSINYVLFREDIVRIENESEIYNIKILFNLNFYELTRITLVFNALSILSLMLFLFVKLKINFIAAFSSASLPTIVVLLLKEYVF
jgi:hypothetical protein